MIPMEQLTAAEEFQADQILKSLLTGLYQRAASGANKFSLPIKLIDQPEVAHGIFRHHDVFVKNYGFLESFAKARFSANGDDWKKRMALTQPYYNRAAEAIGKAGLEQLYKAHLVQYARGEKPNLFQAFLDAAVHVISSSYGFEQAVPWPADIIERVRRCLKVQQALAWMPANPALFLKIQTLLQQDVAELRALWQARADISAFMQELTLKAEGIDHFDPTQELLQNLLAASETTASSLLWMVDCLGRRQQDQSYLRTASDEQREMFIKELLRLFPPVPIISRVCIEPIDIAGISFRANESIAVSLVGLHCNADYWQQPLEFNFPREEFQADRYERMAFVPFISGPRVCGGMRLALAELHAALTQFLDVFKVSVISTPVVFEYGLASRPAQPLESYVILR